MTDMPIDDQTTADGEDWKAQAQFWQMKYFEERTHSQQVITMLMRPQINAAVQRQMQVQAAQLHASMPQATATPAQGPAAGIQETLARAQAAAEANAKAKARTDVNPLGVPAEHVNGNVPAE